MSADIPLDPRFLDDHDNRSGGPERVIDLVEDRAPGGFIDLEPVASHTCGRRPLAGFSVHPSGCQGGSDDD
jgi:hypothetical protein